jgi:hypothetical protein
MMALFGRKNRGGPPRAEENGEVVDIDLDDKSPRSGLLWRDLMLLTEIVDSGADLTQPREHGFVLYFDLKKAADKARVRARRGGYEATVSRCPDDATHRWQVMCERESVLDLTTLIAATDFFQSVADELGGGYGGLQAPV